MMTVVKSPQARLREEMGLAPRVSSSRVRVADWIGFDCGDVVREIGGRHTGRVEAIFDGATIRVRWHETGWTSDLPRDQIEKVTP